MAVRADRERGRASRPGRLRLAGVGASNLEIAAELGLSPETVKACLRTAMRKLEVRNRTAAVHAARLAGLI